MCRNRVGIIRPRADDTYSIPTQLVELIKKIDVNMLEDDTSLLSLAASTIGRESKKRIRKEAFAALAKSISQISKRLRESILWLYAHKEAIAFTPANVELLFLENNESISEATLDARWSPYKLTQLTRRGAGVVISSDGNPNPKTKKTAQAFFLFENVFFAGKEKSRQSYAPKFDLGQENQTSPSEDKLSSISVCRCSFCCVLSMPICCQPTFA